MKDNGGSRSGGSNGSLDGATAADLDRGYSDATPESEKLEDVAECCDPFEKPEGGFVGRPSGWER